MISDEKTEAEIVEKGLDALRITVDTIDAAVNKAVYQRIEGTTVMICVLVMENGYSVIGHSACVSPENFDEALGKKIAQRHAMGQCWALLRYELASRIASGMTTMPA